MVQQSMGAKPRRRTNADLDELQHPLLGDQPTLQLMAPKDATGKLSCPPVLGPVAMNYECTPAHLQKVECAPPATMGPWCLH